MLATLPTSGAPPSHFLSLARSKDVHGRLVPLVSVETSMSPSSNAPYDVSTVAAADYDIDTHSGFMPPDEPIQRLEGAFSLWEVMLERALGKLRLGIAVEREGSIDERKFSESWRDAVRKVPSVDIEGLRSSEPHLRRAHLVLTFLMHLYVHSTVHDPTLGPILVPRSIAQPLWTVSRELRLPPVVTYADTVLWNWSKTHSADRELPDNASFLRRQITASSTFTRTPSENHFYMTSAWIELVGVEALTVMRSAMDELFVADTLSVSRITKGLRRLRGVIGEITRLLLAVREKCDPELFYDEIRPWFNGPNNSPQGWKFEGVEVSADEELAWGTLGGPSAGQSSLIHALDVFLGVNHATGRGGKDEPFLAKMQMYMPRHHRAFLQYLGKVDNPLRTFVLSHEHEWVRDHPESASYRSILRERAPEVPSSTRPSNKGVPPTASLVASSGSHDENAPSSSPLKPHQHRMPPLPFIKSLHQAPLTTAYNGALEALKEFRDAHIRIATLYIIQPAARARQREQQSTNASQMPATRSAEGEPKGTGGTALMPFLKGARDNTRSTLVS